MKKIAIVTGSTRGIGNAIAKKLLSLGYYTIFSDIVESENIDETLITEKINSEYIKCDISNPKDRENLFSFIMKKHNRIDVLVNNAGVAPKIRKDILETTEDSFSFVMDINLKSTFFMCQSAANIMKSIDYSDLKGRIINISSISAYTSSTSRGEYCISKAGISMVTKLFADRLAEFEIPVFEIRPGIILTDMTAQVKDKYDKLISEGLTPIKRFGYPDDIANLVSSLCSGAFDFSTGQVINADGGFHIRRL